MTRELIIISFQLNGTISNLVDPSDNSMNMWMQRAGAAAIIAALCYGYFRYTSKWKSDRVWRKTENLITSFIISTNQKLRTEL